MIDDLRSAGYDVLIRNHADAILERDFPEQLAELCETLLSFTIRDGELIKGGGGEAPSTQRLRKSFAAREWRKHRVEVHKFIEGERSGSLSHEIDHVRQTPRGWIALEIEWNNKDPFYDRDLDNFQRLHTEGAISVGIIVTRGSSLQGRMAWIVNCWAERRGHPLSEPGAAKKFVSSKFGTSTTHWDKLRERVERGVGNPCPLLLLGIPASVVTEDQP